MTMQFLKLLFEAIIILFGDSLVKNSVFILYKHKFKIILKKVFSISNKLGHRCQNCTKLGTSEFFLICLLTWADINIVFNNA